MNGIWYSDVDGVFYLEWRSGLYPQTEPSSYHFQLSFDRNTPSVFTLRYFNIDPPAGTDAYAVGMQESSSNGYTFAIGASNNPQAGWVVRCSTAGEDQSCELVS